MSWQDYVNNNIVANGAKVTRAAIVGVDTMSLWGSSPGFNLSAEEQKAIATAFTNIDQLQVNGIKLAGVKYVLIGGGDDQVIQAKKGASGAVLYRTKQAILVGVYDPPIQQAECNGHIAYHRDYFLSTGF